MAPCARDKAGRRTLGLSIGRWAGALTAPVALGAILALASPGHAARPREGQVAPETTLHLQNGQTVKLSDLRGQVVILNFWATWCGPCRAELPLLDSYYQLQRRHGMRVFAVATEDSLPAAKLKPLFTVLAIEPVRRLSGPYAPINGAVPTNFIIDRAGVMRFAKAGALTLDDLNRELVPLLNEPAPTIAPSAGLL